MAHWYQTLVETTEQVVRQATTVVQTRSQTTGTLAQRLVRLVERVLHQNRQPVFEGKKVSSVRREGARG